MAYDATQALITAIALSPNPTRTSIQKNLANSNFSPSGDRFSNIQLVKIQPGRNKFGYEFVPISRK